MSAVDGALTPPKASQEPHHLSGTKRKRSDSGPPLEDARHEQLEKADAHGRPDASASNLLDVFEVLKRHDTEPSIFDWPLRNSREQSSSDAPTAKRAKLADDVQDESIASRLSAGRYSAVEDLERDVLDVCAARIAAVRAGDQDEAAQAKRLPLEAVAVIQRLMSFEIVARKVFAQAKNDTHVQRSRGKAKGNADPTLSLDLTNGVKAEPVSPKRLHSSRGGRTVLSLFGNAPTPRQLFSSLQQGSGVEGRREIPLEELGLPSMLMASELLPLQAEQDAKASTQSFRDVFAPPASLSQLQPPKATKSSSGRSASISFVAGDALTKASRKGGYPTQPLPVGKWLTYGNDRASAPKKQQRDRSSSTVDVPRIADEDTTAETPNEESLFRTAYSSFAPSFDDSKAIIAEKERNTVWWQKDGERRYGNRFDIEGALEESAAVNGEADGITMRNEVKEFEDMIANFDESTMDAGAAGAAELPESLEQLLLRVSELLEVLASHQRLRNSYIPAPSRTPASPSPLLSTMLGTPSEPSTEETYTYRSLRSQLAELVAQLPPHVVAKLDGEQLEDLQINRRVPFEGKSYKGILEEDQLTRMARSTAAAAAAVKNTPSTSQTYGQYGRTPSTAQPAARLAHTPSLYGSNQGQTSYGRPASQTFNTPANAARQAFSQLGSYTAPVNRNAAQYGAPSSFQNFQRQSYGQQYGQGSPQPQSQSYGAASAIYQNRAHNSSTYAQNTAQSTSYMRNGSPAKPSGYNTSIYPTQPRSAHAPANPLHNTLSYGQQQSQASGSGRATPTQYTQPSSSTPQPSDGSPAGMTSEQQRVMLERQRAQIASQTQARNAAQVDMKQESAATPQPVQQSG